MSSKTSEIFEFNKIIFIYLNTAIIIFLWLIYYILHRSKLYLPKIAMIPPLIFLLVLTVSTIFSIDKHTSFFGYYGRWNGGILSIISYIVLYAIFIQVFNKGNVFKLLKSSLFTSFVVIVLGLLSKINIDFSCLLFTGNISNKCWSSQFMPSVRMFSTLGQPNWLGSYLVPHFFIALYFLINSISLNLNELTAKKGLISIVTTLKSFKLEKMNLSLFLYVIYLVLNLLAIVFTKSRSSLFALIMAFIIGLLLYFCLKIKFAIKNISLSVIVCFSFFLLIFFAGTKYLISLKVMPTKNNITDSFEIRKIVWKGAVKLGAQYPWFGTGPETFAYSYNFVKPKVHNLTSEWNFIYNKAHNEYLNYFANTGYLGLLSYLALISFAIYIFSVSAIGNSQKNKLATMIFIGYISVLITNFFGFSTSTTQLFFYLFPGMALALNKNKELIEGNIPVTYKVNNSLKILSITFSVLFCVFAIKYVSNYYFADRMYKKGRDYMGQGRYFDAEKSLRHALKLKYEHVYEDQLSIALANLAVVSSYEDKNLSAKRIKESKDSNSHTQKLSPYNIQYLKTNAKNHYLFYQITHSSSDIQKSIDSMKNVVRIAPLDAESYYTLAIFYVISDSYREDSLYRQKAISALKQALILRPQYVEAQELIVRLVFN